MHAVFTAWGPRLDTFHATRACQPHIPLRTFHYLSGRGEPIFSYLQATSAQPEPFELHLKHGSPSCVVSTTFVHGGSAYNIIPGTVEMGGTLRSLTREGYGMLHEKTAGVLRGAAATFGCTLNLTASTFDHDCLRQPPPEGAPGSCTFPPTGNHPNGYATARAAAPGPGAGADDDDVLALDSDRNHIVATIVDAPRRA